MGYAKDDASVRVDVFKPSGKWCETYQVMFTEYSNPNIHEAFEHALVEAGIELEAGFMAVCLNPYHKYEHPLMYIFQ